LKLSRQKRVPMMAPEPRLDFVARPKEFDALKQQLLDAKGDAVTGITAALKGRYGKTTLAKALSRVSLNSPPHRGYSGQRAVS
jgi:hypothetical protein